MEVLKTELRDPVEGNSDKELLNRNVSGESCGRSEDEVQKDSCDELQDVVKFEDCDREKDVTYDDCADNQVIENVQCIECDKGAGQTTDSSDDRNANSGDCSSKQQEVAKNDNSDKDPISFDSKEQNEVNCQAQNKEQDVEDDSGEKQDKAKKDIQYKEHETVKKENCIEKQQDEEKINSSKKRKLQQNEATEHGDACNVNSEESENINGQTTFKKGENSDCEENDSQLSRDEQSNVNSTKLSELKGSSTHNVRKLRDVSQVLRNKRRSQQREQIHTRHSSRSTSKDTVKLLKKKRSVSRQSSTCQDDDQSVHSGTKRKRIPNRPGISFEVGARIEAKDYLDKWYPSKIIAVDEEEAEVLIHFERWSSRFDEWMPMESPRIRAITHPSTRNEQKEKTSKVMPQYKAGEAVLARWTDCKMYPAKVLEVGANNCYEVLFYDGFHRTVQSLNIEKLPKEMTNKVDFPPVSKSESPERKKPNPISKDLSKPPPKKVDKIAKDKTTKRDQNDLTSILGKRKRLIVGGIFRAKRNDEKSNSKQKCRKVSSHERESNLNVKSNEVETPPSPVGYIDGRKIARKEFIIEEDHNHFKCPAPSCGKSFRKDKLLQSHMKHYHGDSRNREKKKASPLLVRESKTAINVTSEPLSPSPSNDKTTEKEETKTEVIKTKLKSPVKEEVSKDVPKSINTQLTTSPKASSKPNNQENLKGKVPKCSRTDAKHSKINTISEAPVDNKASAVRSDGRITRSEKSPKIEHKTTRAETRSSKPEGKLVKAENKNIKTENRIAKAESKAAKAENKIIKSEPKTIRSENKTIKNENRTIKSENKTIKTENKPVEEKTEKSKLGQENKIAEEVSPSAIQPLTVTEDIKNLENGLSTTTTTQGPVLPQENGHTSRTKKRRTVSASEVNIDAVASVDNTHSVMPKEMDIKPEQKLVDIGNLQDDVKPMITDIKPAVQEDEPDDGQSDEIVHCICNCIEENGLMMQCEVCLTWQHGTCFDIDDVKEVPDKYVCYACLKPIGLRESFRYRHDLDWFNKGEMTTFSFLDEKPSPSVVSETLSAHDLVASLHNVMQVLHSLQIKLKFAKEDNHPELIMWKKPWMDYSYSHCQDTDNSEEQVQPARADFDHSYFSVKEDILVTTNALNTKRSSYDKVSKRENTSIATQDGETSQCFDRNKTSVNCTKGRTTDKERTTSKQSFVKTEMKPNVDFDPTECKKNLLDHLIQMQHGVEQQLNIIEEHVQVLESEMGIPTLSDEDLHKEMGKSLCTIRKLMKDLSFVQQLTNFQ